MSPQAKPETKQKHIRGPSVFGRQKTPKNGLPKSRGETEREGEGGRKTVRLRGSGGKADSVI